MINEKASLILILGPCVIESEELMSFVGHEVNELSRHYNFSLYLKGSYRKANRSKLNSYTGLGDNEALQIINKIGKKLNVNVITDVHSSEECQIAAEFVDVLQIPAFLSRQTDLLIAAGKTGKPVNIKKGQFMSADSMKFAVEKVESTGNTNILITERGTFFGYQDLVVDFRSIPIMKQFGYPVIVDCTHSLQKPNQSEGVTGGNPHMIETIAKAAIAVGADGLFIETHPDPKSALSDGENMLELKKLPALIDKITKLYSLVQSFN